MNSDERKGLCGSTAIVPGGASCAKGRIEYIWIKLINVIYAIVLTHSSEGVSIAISGKVNNVVGVYLGIKTLEELSKHLYTMHKDANFSVHGMVCEGSLIVREYLFRCEFNCFDVP